MAKRALVTGACGFVGSHPVERLAARGWDVVTTDLERADRASYYLDGDGGGTDGASVERPGHGYYRDRLEGIGARFQPADVTDRSTLEPLFGSHYDAVFHTASLYDYFAEWDALYAVNVEGGRNVGEVAAENDVGHFVHWSTLGVCGGSDAEKDDPSGRAPHTTRTTGTADRRPNRSGHSSNSGNVTGSR